MRSAGNDIVALSAINAARTHTKPFYSKILSEPELALYELLSANILFEHYVHLLWSIKESGYKFLKRFDPEMLFTPVKFEVQQLEIPKGYELVSFDRGDGSSIITGLILVGDHQFYSRSVIYMELISSVVDDDECFNGVHNNIKYIRSTDHAVQSAEVRIFIIEELKQLTGRLNLILQKNEAGIPVLVDGEEELPIPVSLSHHGNYVAYSFKLNA